MDITLNNVDKVEAEFSCGQNEISDAQWVDVKFHFRSPYSEHAPVSMCVFFNDRNMAAMFASAINSCNPPPELPRFFTRGPDGNLEVVS